MLPKKRKPLPRHVRTAQAYYRLAAKASRAGNHQAQRIYHETAERHMRYANANRKERKP